MKVASTLAIAGAVTLTSAQIISNPNGTFTCPVVNGTYCAGANIIIRCLNGVGQPGNCDDNLDGEPPVGLNYAPCFSCDATSGAAACSKNGIVYVGSGSGLGDVDFPVNSTTACASAVSSSSTCTTSTTTSVSVNPGGPIISATTAPPSGYPVPSSNVTTSVPVGPIASSGPYSGPFIPITNQTTSIPVVGPIASSGPYTGPYVPITNITTSITVAPPPVTTTPAGGESTVGAGSTGTTAAASTASSAVASAATNAATNLQMEGSAFLSFGGLLVLFGMM